MEKYEDYLDKWLGGLESEIAFWKRYMETKGDIYYDRLKVCCLDSELEGIGGTVFDVEKLTHKNTPYKLCHYCDPDWTSNYQ